MTKWPLHRNAHNTSKKFREGIFCSSIQDMSNVQLRNVCCTLTDLSPYFSAPKKGKTIYQSYHRSFWQTINKSGSSKKIKNSQKNCRRDQAQPTSYSWFILPSWSWMVIYITFDKACFSYGSITYYDHLKK